MTTGNAYIIPKNGWLGATVASSGGFVLVIDFLLLDI